MKARCDQGCASVDRVRLCGVHIGGNAVPETSTSASVGDPGIYAVVKQLLHGDESVLFSGEVDERLRKLAHRRTVSQVPFCLRGIPQLCMSVGLPVHRHCSDFRQWHVCPGAAVAVLRFAL